MENTTRTIAFALVALALLIVGCIAIHQGHEPLRLIAGLGFLFGTATVTYAYPVVGTVAPTIAQMQNANMVTATVNLGDTDTTAAVTHNLGANVASLFPWVQIYPAALGTPSNTSPPIITIALTNSEAVTFTKVSATNSGGTWNVLISRPYSPST